MTQNGFGARLKNSDQGIYRPILDSKELFKMVDA
jgi:hypothetical protein